MSALSYGSPEWEAVNVATTALADSASSNAAFWTDRGWISDTSRSWLTTQRGSILTLRQMIGLDELSGSDAMAVGRVDAALALPGPPVHLVAQFSHASDGSASDVQGQKG